MTRGEPSRPKLKTIAKRYAGSPDHDIEEWLYRSGLVALTERTTTSPSEGAMRASPPPLTGLFVEQRKWQFMQELRVIEGMFQVAMILLDPDYGALANRPLEELEAEIQAELERVHVTDGVAQERGMKDWGMFRASLMERYREFDTISNPGSKTPALSELEAKVLRDLEALLGGLHQSVSPFRCWPGLVRGFWADTCAEPLSIIWLAAMAEHALYFADDLYAFGYLTALLNQKLSNELLFERGVINKKATDSGGEARRQARQAANQAIIAAMKIHIDKGRSEADAALRVFEREHLGKSADANRQIWRRNTKK
jgi:hypothetical protein